MEKDFSSALDVTGDNLNCGGCGVVCKDAKNCIGGQCLCPPGTLLCSGVCRYVDGDVNNCGGCGVQCFAPPQPIRYCVNGKCQNCKVTEVECGNVCADLATSAANCGACGKKCPDSAICVASVCTCPRGWLLCNNACQRVDNDPKNCGGCGVVCAPGEACWDSNNNFVIRLC